MNLTGVFRRTHAGLFRVVFAASAAFCLGTLAFAGPIGLTINAVFDSSLTSDAQAAINTAIQNLEANIASPNDITVSIYFNTCTGGCLGESLSTTYNVLYSDYYTQFSNVAVQPNQVTALGSLGGVPLAGGGNPVNGNSDVTITSSEGRNLGFNTPGGVNQSNGQGLVNGAGTYDTAIGLNTSLAVPVSLLDGSHYSLQSVAAHEIDEVLGIGGTGSTIGGASTNPVGDLDLFRYSGNGVRSYTTSDASQPYLSIDHGMTVLSYFNQAGGGSDYSDWQSNPDHTGFGVQVQDAFGSPGVNPTLGANEITALNIIGYDVVGSPEPSTIALVGLGLVGFGLLRRRHSANR